MELLAKEDINIGRQKNIDYAKALAVIFMIAVHVILHPEATALSDTGWLLIDGIFGSFFAAPVFMFAMGVGIVYSRKKEPDQLMKRGCQLLLLNYVTNLLRFLVPMVLPLADGEPGAVESVLYGLLFGDILAFAGFSFVAFGLLKKAHLTELQIALIAILMNVLCGIVLPEIISENIFLCVTGGLFVPILYGVDDMAVAFPFIPWFVFVALGAYFGTVLKKVKNLDGFYLFLGAGGGVLSVLLLLLEGQLNTTGLFEGFYYCEYFNRPMMAIISISIIFFELGLLHFLTKFSSVGLDGFMRLLSECVNEIYILSWVIILNVNEVLFGFVFPRDHSPWLYLLLFFTTSAISIPLAKKWKDHKRAKNQKKWIEFQPVPKGGEKTLEERPEGSLLC